MDVKLYSKQTIDRFRSENLFFRDAKLKKYFDRNEARDLGKFRKRMRDTYGSKSFEKFVYVFVTDACLSLIHI